MTVLSRRLAAGTLVLALPLAAAAGCGVEKKRTVGAELASARKNLAASKATSVTLRLTDTRGNLTKAFTSGDDPAPRAIAEAVLGGGITVTLDPAGSRTLQQVSAASSTTSYSPQQLATQLQAVQFSLAVKDSTATLGELRLVDGVLYARADLAEIGRLAKEGGATGFDDGLTGVEKDPTFGPLVKDVRAGKWAKLDIKPFLTQLADLAKTLAPQTAPKPGTSFDPKKVGNDLFAAVKPFVKVTDANDSSSDRVLDVRVQLRPAVKAALAVLRSSKGIPGLSKLLTVDDAKVDAALSTGTVDGQIRLADGHLTQLSLDLESARKVGAKPSGPVLAGGKVVLDVDDSADPVTAPTDVSAVDLGALVQQFLKQASGGLSGSSATSSLGSSYAG